MSKSNTFCNHFCWSLTITTLILGIAISVISCDSPTGSGTADDDDIVLGNGSVTITEVPPASLPVGQNAIFTLSLDLPAVSGSDEGYRVWVYPVTDDGYCFRSSEVLDASAANFQRYAYLVAPDAENCSPRQAGTVETWTVSISTWDGSENTGFAAYSFDQTITWE